MFNVENAVENIYANPAFFLASDHNQTSGVVRKACKNHWSGTFWWSARHFTDTFTVVSLGAFHFYPDHVNGVYPYVPVRIDDAGRYQRLC